MLFSHVRYQEQNEVHVAYKGAHPEDKQKTQLPQRQRAMRETSIQDH